MIWNRLSPMSVEQTVTHVLDRTPRSGLETYVTPSLDASEIYAVVSAWSRCWKRLITAGERPTSRVA